MYKLVYRSVRHRQTRLYYKLVLLSAAEPLADVAWATPLQLLPLAPFLKSVQLEIAWPG